MRNSMYVLSPTVIWAHYGSSVRTLRDGASSRREEVDAMVRSGDYFMDLATKLDMIAQGLPEESVTGHALNQLVSDLLYLHKQYALAKKPSDKKPPSYTN